jgi:hypothetical protein
MSLEDGLKDETFTKVSLRITKSQNQILTDLIKIIKDNSDRSARKKVDAGLVFGRLLEANAPKTSSKTSPKI